MNQLFQRVYEGGEPYDLTAIYALAKVQPPEHPYEPDSRFPVDSPFELMMDVVYTPFSIPCEDSNKIIRLWRARSPTEAMGIAAYYASTRRDNRYLHKILDIAKAAVNPLDEQGLKTLHDARFDLIVDGELTVPTSRAEAFLIAYAATYCAPDGTYNEYSYIRPPGWMDAFRKDRHGGPSPPLSVHTDVTGEVPQDTIVMIHGYKVP